MNSISRSFLISNHFTTYLTITDTICLEFIRLTTSSITLSPTKS
uniref:Uncharacterized protein n=1 Tax=Amphimedon queenslandica TaxID=400682 RepID=A0A1X7SQE8_AMPQE